MRYVRSTPNYLHKDQLGSVKLITSDSGTPIKRSFYDPYGEVAGTVLDLTAANETKGLLKLQHIVL